MTEDDVRRIVREELALLKKREGEAIGATMASFRDQMLAQNAPAEEDGPFLAEIKALMREGL